MNYFRNYILKCNAVFSVSNIGYNLFEKKTLIQLEVKKNYKCRKIYIVLYFLEGNTRKH